MNLENTAKDEMFRQLRELALQCGRSKQSPQTHYIHYSYHHSEEERQDTIPLVENVLFALTLFNTRISENIAEAKSIIEHLLHFQSQKGEFSIGNFPVYLHEYPVCSDYYTGVLLLTPFYWILKSYSLVLGNDLKQRLESASKALLHHCLHIHKEKQPSYNITIKIAAAAKAFGTLLNQPSLEQEGETLLEKLHSLGEVAAWHSPSQLSDILIALQMVYPSIQKSPWTEFWSYIASTWHFRTCCYAGPAVKEFQSGDQPQPTLYDLFLGYFSGTFSRRSLLMQPFQLQASLIQQSDDDISPPPYPLKIHGKIGNQAWFLSLNDNCAYSVIEKEGVWNPATERGSHLFRMLWGNTQKAHSLACQGGNSRHTTFQIHENGVDLFFLLGEMVQAEDREKNREISFYFDFDGRKEAIVKVNGTNSNTFLLENEVKVSLDHLTFSIKFSIEEGDGHFFGHIMQGNRPSQLCLKGVNRFQAYDRQIFLRTLRRSEHCKIKAEIRILENEAH